MLKEYKIKAIIVVFLFLLLQLTLVPFLQIHGIAPDLLLLLCISFLFIFDNKNYVFIILLISFLKELYTNNYFGIELFSGLSLLLFFDYLRKKIDIHKLHIKYFTFLLLCLTYFFLKNCLSSLFFEMKVSVLNLYSGAFSSFYTFLLYCLAGRSIELTFPKKSLQFELFS